MVGWSLPKGLVEAELGEDSLDWVYKNVPAGFQKSESEIGVPQSQVSVQEVTLLLWFPGPVALTPDEEPECSQLTPAFLQLSRPPVWAAGDLVKHSGGSGAGHRMLQLKATGWLLHHQRRWTGRPEGGGPQGSSCQLDCLPPGR